MFSQNARRRVVDVPMIVIWGLVYMQAYLEIVISEIQASLKYLVFYDGYHHIGIEGKHLRRPQP